MPDDSCDANGYHPIRLRYHCIQRQANEQMSAPSISEPDRTRPARLTRNRRTAILKALADPKRFELLERIAKSSCPLGCSVVRPALAISPATLSHHIKELETAGLINVERQGKFHFLTLRPGVLEALMASLSALEKEACENRTSKP
jgi:ArsR family transcriptional regulator